MARPKKPEALKRKHRLMVYLTEKEQQTLSDLAHALNRNQTDLVYEGLHTVFTAMEKHARFPEEGRSISYDECKTETPLLDGQTEPYGRKIGEWLPGDPCKVRFFAAQHANQRGVVRVVEEAHCQVQLHGDETLVRIPRDDLIDWDDEDEAWIMAPSAYRDDDDLNSDEYPGNDDPNEA